MSLEQFRKFSEAHKVMTQHHGTDYFKIHSEVDEKHEHMAKELLTSLT